MGYLLAACCIVLWGLVQIPIKLARAPGRIGVMISMPVGIVTMLIILLAQGKFVVPTAPGRDWLLTLLMGVCMFPAATYTYFEAVQRAGITTAAPITRLTPLLVVTVSAAFGLAELSWTLVSAGVMIFVGGVFLARGAHHSQPTESRGNLRVGLLYASVACVMWAAGNLLVAQVSNQMSRALVLFYGLTFGALVHWGIMTLAGQLKQLRSVRRLDLLLYCIHGVVSFALGYWAFFESIRILGVNEASVITGCWPAVAVAAGIIVFREPMSLQKLVGIVLFIGSAVLAGIARWM
jgi:drug/metabolite transporter (DMT)-like permease